MNNTHFNNNIFSVRKLDLDELTISGNLNMGNSPLGLATLTTVERDNLTNPQSGDLIYNSTGNELNYYNGSAWTSLTGGGGGDHWLLSNLQGGTTNEYYHFTNTEHTNLQSALTAGIHNLTSAEVTQLQNIDTNTISNTQWGYLGVMDQNLRTIDSPTFTELKTTSIDSGGAANLFLQRNDITKVSIFDTKTEFNENVNLVTGKTYNINDVSVLSNTTLGSSVVNSSLTSVGTLTSLQVDNINLDSNIIKSTGLNDLVFHNPNTIDVLTIKQNNQLNVWNGLINSSPAPAAVTAHCDYADNADLDIFGGSATATLTLATVSGGQLKMNNLISRCVYSGTSNFNVNPNTFTIRFKFQPLYTHPPSTNQEIFVMQQSEFNGNNYCKIIQQSSNGNLNISIKDQVSTTIYSATPPWVHTQNNIYDFEWNIDTVTGAHRLFIDGVLFNTGGGTGTRSTSIAYVQLGSKTLAQNFNISNLTYYNAVQHTANFTPDTNEFTNDVVGFAFKNNLYSGLSASTSALGLTESTLSSLIFNVKDGASNKPKKIFGITQNNCEMFSGITFLSDTINTNTINEKTLNNGVTVDGVLIKDNLVDGRDVSVDGTTLDNLNTTIGLSALTSAEVDQLENINSVTINNTQWGYLGATDQALSTVNNVIFNQVTTPTVTTPGDLTLSSTTNGKVILPYIIDTGGAGGPNVSIRRAGVERFNIGGSGTTSNVTFKAPTFDSTTGDGVYSRLGVEKWRLENALNVSKQSISVDTGFDYRINNVSVLTNTTLGSSVVNSSLTSLGNLTTLNVNTINETTANNGVRIDKKIQIKNYTTVARDALTSVVAGDVIYNTDNNELDFYNGTSWAAVSSGGAGDVTGPGSSVNNNIVFFDGTTGKLIKDSTYTINQSLQTTDNVTFNQITGTLQTAAQANITSVGTLTALDVDNININGNSIISTDLNGNISLQANGTGKIFLLNNTDISDLTVAAEKITPNKANTDVILEPSGTGDVLLNGRVIIDKASGVKDLYFGDPVDLIRIDRNGNDLEMNATGLYNLRINNVPRLEFTNNSIRNSNWVTGLSGNTIRTDASGYLWEDISSARYKKNITPCSMNTDFIYNLKFSNFEYNTKGSEPGLRCGYIAEDLDVFPNARAFLNYKMIDGVKCPNGINYDKLICPVIEEMKKLKKEIDILKSYH